MKEVTIYSAKEEEVPEPHENVGARIEETLGVEEQAEMEHSERVIDVAKETKVTQIQKKLEGMKEAVETVIPRKESIEETEAAPNKIEFYGQHSDERILYRVKPHPYTVYVDYVKVVLATLVVVTALGMLSRALPVVAGVVGTITWWVGLLMLFGGVVIVKLSEEKNIAYITDRRVVRFMASTPFVTNSRSLNWDEAVKVKTFAPNMFWRLFNIGDVVVHAKSTVVNLGEAALSENTATDDDVALTGVYYFRDLGNYIDKILYLYKQKSPELTTIRPFVAKPRGRRG